VSDSVFENENAAATPRFFCLCRGSQAHCPPLRADFTSGQHFVPSSGRDFAAQAISPRKSGHNDLIT
jgi:hypothetical protein